MKERGVLSFAGVRHINVERLIDDVMHSLKAEKLDLSQTPNQPEMADYLLCDPDCVFELKTLSEDPEFKDSFHEKATLVFKKMLELGLIDPRPKGTIVDFSEFSENARIYAMNALAKPIVERLLSKANRQIRSTKESRSVPDAFGCVILINDANTFLLPNGLLGLSYELMNCGRFKHIHFVVICTCNMPLCSDNEEEMLFVMLPGFMSYPPDEVWQGIASQFMKTYSRYYGIHAGVKTISPMLNNLKVLDSFRYKRGVVNLEIDTEKKDD